MKSDIQISSDGIRMVRVFDAPRPKVFQWWSQADKLRQWSGCKGARNCEVEMDFRVGGTFTQKMEIEGAGTFSFSGRYLDIVEPELIAYTAQLGPVETRVRVEFIEQGQATKVVLTHKGLTGEFLCKTVSHGTSESFDKLDAVLAGHAVEVI